MKTPPNTYRKGRLTFISYPTNKGTFIAACDELCILVEEKDLELAKYKMLAQSKLYLETVIQKKLGQHLLNQTLPKEVKAEFSKFIKKLQAERWTCPLEKVIKEDIACVTQ